MKKLSIPKYRLDYIEKVLKDYIDRYQIKDWPVDCVALLGKMARLKSPLVKVRVESGMHKDTDACTIYHKKARLYEVIFNKDRFSYPYKRSKDRRTNFTAGHEIGHIALGHLELDSKLKTRQEVLIEELEADEFAARLLMPKDLVFTCSYSSFSDTAAYMKVSQSALKRRLANLDRQDLVLRRRERACPVCGNKTFSMFASFCPICGRDTRLGLNGIRVRFYPDLIRLDRYKRALACPLCGMDLRDNKGERCSLCGTLIFNFCISYLRDGSCSFANPGNARFCEMCGRPSYYYEKGYIGPWQEASRNGISN